jgi:hypothetical protein
MGKGKKDCFGQLVERLLDFLCNFTLHLKDRQVEMSMVKLVYC